MPSWKLPLWLKFRLLLNRAILLVWMPLTEPTENVSKAEQSRFWITFLLEDLPVDATFHPGLLHITLIPWFVSELEDRAVIDAFKEKFGGQKKFEVKLGEEAKFGPKRNV